MPAEAQKGIKRPRKVLKVSSVSSPLIIWSESDSPENHFFPTGWMGDLDSITMDDASHESPHSGKTCLKIIYSPKGPNSWAGIYFQYPLNNWGDYPGYNISGPRRVTFWARGEKGGEKAEFKVGGINSPGKSYKDSFGPVSSGILKLPNQWVKYTINLKRKDL